MLLYEIMELMESGLKYLVLVNVLVAKVGTWGKSGLEYIYSRNSVRVGWIEYYLELLKNWIGDSEFGKDLSAILRM